MQNERPPGWAWLRPLAGAALRMLISTAVGLAFGVAYWAVGISLAGNSVILALEGQVEDGIGLLMGLIALGATVGSGVGILWVIGGLASRVQRSTREGRIQ